MILRNTAFMGNGIKEKIEDANKKAVGKVLASNPILVDVKPAIDVVPGMKKNMIMHAGPPIDWQNMCEPMKGAVMGTLLFEGLAETKTRLLRLSKTEKLNSHQTMSIMQ